MLRNVLHIENQLKKMPVLLPASDEPVGQISDVIIHPTEGSILGLSFRLNEREEYSVSSGDFIVVCSRQAVALLPGWRDGSAMKRAKMNEGISLSREILGIQVVTELGKYLGFVCEAFLVDEPLEAIYRVVQSRWQKWAGDGFYMAADIPYGWSRAGSRLLVPADARERSSVLSPALAIDKKAAHRSHVRFPKWI